MYEPDYGRGEGRRGPKFAALVLLSVVGGALAIFGIAPGYELEPFPTFAALACACLCFPLARALARSGVRPLVLAAVILGPAGAAAGWLYASAPKAIDRHAYTAVETALLARVGAYAGSPGPADTEPATSSDWGITFFNPPETYLTSRRDALPPTARLPEVTRFYAEQLRGAGLDVSHFTLHLPPAEEEVDGERGAVLISAVIAPTSVQLVVRCERNGPIDRNEIEPPCHVGG